MNERIKELAEQARAEVRNEWDKGNKISYPEAHYQFQRDNDQQFAELIVKECANVVFNKVGPKTALDVLNHFGVTE